MEMPRVPGARRSLLTYARNGFRFVRQVTRGKEKIRISVRATLSYSPPASLCHPVTKQTRGNKAAVTRVIKLLRGLQG